MCGNGIGPGSEVLGIGVNGPGLEIGIALHGIGWWGVRNGDGSRKWGLGVCSIGFGPGVGVHGVRMNGPGLGICIRVHGIGVRGV